MNRLPKPTVSRYSPQNNPMTSCLAQGRAKKICTLLMYTMAYITSSVQIYYGTTTMKSGSTKEVFQLLRYSWFVSRSLHNQELHVRPQDISRDILGRSLNFLFIFRCSTRIYPHHERCEPKNGNVLQKMCFRVFLLS